ncbi:hypothetical protein BKA81DRAFT_22863 [Phyllosticta paracitricarpa]
MGRRQVRGAFSGGVFFFFSLLSPTAKRQDGMVWDGFWFGLLGCLVFSLHAILFLCDLLFLDGMIGRVRWVGDYIHSNFSLLLPFWLHSAGEVFRSKGVSGNSSLRWVHHLPPATSRILSPVLVVEAGPTV